MSIFDPLSLPFQRVQTYVDLNPPAVLSNEFYNPAQDALARLWGAAVGYSTSATNEEFVLPAPLTIPATGDGFGAELAVFNNPGTSYQFQSAATPFLPDMHGVYHVDGTAAGNRGGGVTGFGVSDSLRNLGTLRWIFRARIRWSKFSILSTAPPGLVIGLSPINDGVHVLPSWIADGTSGFWTTFGGPLATITAIPTVDNEWVTLWIANRDADAQVRWYLKRDTDPLPLLLDTQTIAVPNIANARRYFRNLVTAGAVAADYMEIDNIGLVCER